MRLSNFKGDVDIGGLYFQMRKTVNDIIYMLQFLACHNTKVFYSIQLPDTYTLNNEMR